MAVEITAPEPSQAVAHAIAACPEAAQARLADIRALIFETAARHDEIGPLTETLKWGEPSYAPKRPRIGTALRLGWDAAGEAVRLFVHCQTRVAEDWRAQYDGQLDIIGNRELRLPVAATLPRDALAHCIAMALTYHLRKKSS